MAIWQQSILAKEIAGKYSHDTARKHLQVYIYMQVKFSFNVLSVGNPHYYKNEFQHILNFFKGGSKCNPLLQMERDYCKNPAPGKKILGAWVTPSPGPNNI